MPHRLPPTVPSHLPPGGEDLIRYHADLMRAAEGVRSAYSRFLPLFILSVVVTVAMGMAVAIKEPRLYDLSDPGIAGAWLRRQSMTALTVGMVPPLFALGYLLLMVLLGQREQAFEDRAEKIRNEIDVALHLEDKVTIRRGLALPWAGQRQSQASRAPGMEPGPLPGANPFDVERTGDPGHPPGHRL